MAHRRTPIEKEKDKEFAINLWLQGWNVREISKELEVEHERNGNPYKLSYVTVSTDIAEIIEEAKKNRDKSGINILEDVIQKYEHIYQESLYSHRLRSNPLHVGNALKALENIAKLRGLSVDKAELTIKYDIDIE